MNSDRELLELAAKAIGRELMWTSFGMSAFKNIASTGPAWNPLTDDGDAFRLVVKLNLNIRYEAEPDGPTVSVDWDSHDLPVTAGAGVWEYLDKDSCAATRRAVTRAAAEIGRQV